MSYTLSPNMSLRIPGVGSEAGPDYAVDINYDLLSILDSHDHSPGNGAQVTPAGININEALTFAGNFATNVAGVSLSAQSSTPANGTVYESGVDLYYVDGLGNVVRITQSGAVAGTPGSITGLVAPASVTYVSGSQTFVFQSNTSTSGNVDAGSVIIREVAASANGITLSSPTALAGNYTWVLPGTLPATLTSMLGVSTAGAMSNIAPDNSTLQISGATIQIKAGGVGATQIAAGAVGPTQLASTAVTPGSYTNASITVDQQGRLTAASSSTTTTSGTYTPTTSSESNCNTSAGAPFQYIRVGNTVTISGQFSIIVSTTGAFSFRFSLPAAVVNNFTSNGQLSGSYVLATPINSAYVRAVTSSVLGLFTGNATSGSYDAFGSFTLLVV